MRVLKGLYSTKEPDRSPRTPVTKQSARTFPIAIYESELQAIGQDSVSWETETGGDLFGLWADIPIIFLASRAGPKAQRDHAHFGLDIDYLIDLSEVLQRDWGLRYFGDWHSHHRLGLERPSGGDQRRIASVAAKNDFGEMAEFIVTFAGQNRNKQQIKINPYAYMDLPSLELTDASLVVLREMSPVRSALMANSALPEQELGLYSSFSLDDLTIPAAKTDHHDLAKGISAHLISEKLLERTVAELTTVASGAPEIYRESFGYIIAVPANRHQYVGLAFSDNWPHELLQIDWIDRSSGATEEVMSGPDTVFLKDASDLKMIFLDTARRMTDEVK